MIQKLSIRIVAVAVELFILTIALGCRGTRSSGGPSPAADSNSQTSATNYHTGSQSTINERRIALVIGNSRYRYISYLRNPRHDAVLVAKALKSDGFQLVDGGPQID